MAAVQHLHSLSKGQMRLVVIRFYLRRFVHFKNAITFRVCQFSKLRWETSSSLHDHLTNKVTRALARASGAERRPDAVTL
jgi:hypothetical protein